MEVLRNKSSQSGISDNYKTRDRYETGKIGAWKHGIAALMLALKELEINAESIPVHINQVNTATQQLKDKDETPTVMVHEGQINETT